VWLECAPPCNRFLVSEERERHNLAEFGEALEALDRDEAVDLLEEWNKSAGDVEILPSPAFRRPHLEDDGNHRCLPSSRFRSDGIVQTPRVITNIP
jgi:hypothetical protein